VVAGDGSGLRRLTYTASAVSPAWSPSGDQIAFSVVHRYPVTIEEHGRKEHGAYGETARLWSIRPDGSGAQPLEPEPPTPATLIDHERALRKLRRQISREGKSKVLKRLLERGLQGREEDYAGGFTPDGSQLVFTRYAVEPAIMAIPARGGHPLPLVKNASEPALSPDGRLLAFDSARAHNGQICASEDYCQAATELYVANSDASNQRRLTHTNSIDELMPMFSRDGGTIAYVHGEGIGAAECTAIWQSTASRGASRPLLAAPSCNTWYYDPAWRP
jgi:Tol biopolymer transport system component